MIELEINGKNYDCPSGWDEVTLGTFYEMVDLEEMKEIKSDIQFTIDNISILTKCPVDVLFSLKSTSYVELLNQLKWMETPPKSDKKKILISGEEYQFVENLDDLTVGESISIEMIVKDSKGSHNKSFLNMLPILLRKPGEKFDPNKMESRKELFFNKLVITDVIYFSNFFLTGDEISSTITKDTSGS